MTIIREIVSTADFDSEISKPNLTVVKFTAKWCPPCKQIAPFVETLQQKYPVVNFISVDVDVSPVARERGINSMPTFQFYVSGQKFDQIVGANPTTLESKVDKYKDVSSSNMPTPVLDSGSESDPLKQFILRINPEEITTLFNQLDANKNGTLEADEFRAFICGRFYISPDKLFALYDVDKNSTIDVDEFKLIIDVMNKICAKYDREEINGLTSKAQAVGAAGCFAYCCCICTLGISCCCLIRATNDMAQYMEKSNERKAQYNLKIGEELLAHKVPQKKMQSVVVAQVMETDNSNDPTLFPSEVIVNETSTLLDPPGQAPDDIHVEVSKN